MIEIRLIDLRLSKKWLYGFFLIKKRQALEKFLTQKIHLNF